MASGLGTVDANVLVTDWSKVTFTKSTTTLTIPSSFSHGQTISVSGTVTGNPTPTGDVALLTDSPEQAQQGQTMFTLSGGAYSSASLSTPINYLPGGTYNVWAQYGGDAYNALSNSAKTQVTVSPEASSLFFLVLSPTSSGLSYLSSGTGNIPYGTQLSLSATPVPSSQYTAFSNCEIGTAKTCPVFDTATGTVTFKDGNTTLNVAPVNVEDEAEYTPPTGFNVGSHSITAAYSGDNSYNASTSSATTFTVVQNTPQVLLSTPADPYTQGQAATVNILVASEGVGAAPTGSVALTGTLPAGMPTTATLSTGVDPDTGTTVGLATVVIPATAPAGTYMITATYTPDSASSTNYATASGGLGVQITAASGIATTTTATPSATATSPTAAITVIGTVTAASGAAPTGTVSLLAGAISGNGQSATTVTVASASLVAGTGTSSTFSFVLDSSSLLQGANQLTVYYGGSTTDAASSTLINIANPLSDFSLITGSTIVPLTVGGSGTETIQITSINGFSGAVNLTCSAATGVTCSIAPTSTTLTSAGTNTATLTVNAGSSATAGSYNVLVTGSGPSGAFVHTLNMTATVVATPFVLSGGSASITVAPGAATGNTASVSVTGSGAFNGTINLTCSISPVAASDPATCGLSPASVTISGTTPQTVTLTVNTTAATSASNHPMKLFWPSAGGAALALVFLFGIPARRRNWLAMLGLLLLFVSVAGMGCGGGGGSSSGGGGGGGGGNTGTTPGNYTVTITGTSGTLTPVTTTVALTVN
jgi:hypothetical protein